MHNIDRTQLEFDPETEAYENEQYEMPGELYEVLNEAEQLELAAELLEVRDEQELDRFLGKLIRRVGGALGRVIRSPIGQAIGGALKGVAKQALPMAGTALGAMVGGPLGAKVGSGVASMASDALGLEYESLNQEDREFEGAKQFVQMAANTVQKATEPSAPADPRAAAQAAVAQAAQTFAPAMARSAAPAFAGPSMGPGGGRGRAGRWMRRGNKIVLYGV